MNKKDRKSSPGFSLIELLVATAVIAILVGVVIGVAGVANRKSAESDARVGLQNVAVALEEYKVRYGRYPRTLDNLTGEDGEPVITTDPWGRSFMYIPDDSNYQRFELWSDGMKVDDVSDDISYSMDGL